MYKRYVDDVNEAIACLPPGSRWSNEERKMVVVQEEIDNDMSVAGDVRTLKEVVKMGSSICDMIQLTGECPTSSPGGKMPVLDLACWLGEEGTVWWQHYRKPVANFLVMLERSAMPSKMKRTVLTQEVIRILRNCRDDLPWPQKAAFLTEHSIRMKASGYSERFREQVINAGLKGFDQMKAVAEAGGRPVNRKSSWNREQRKRTKMSKSITWHKSGNYDVPLFVPCTPNSELARNIQALERDTAFARPVRIKIVETGGISMKSLLQRSDPWSKGQCGRPDCFPCMREKGGDCQKSNVTYLIRCLECEARGIDAEYKGETARNMYCRGKEHLQDYRSRSEASVMWAHCKKVHESQPVEFYMRQTESYVNPIPAW